jgi:hypothetical protein
MDEDLRRLERVNVCCRVVVRDRFGIWTGVTENISNAGCQIVSPRLLRQGSKLQLVLSSDLFPEELDAVGEVAWTTADRLGVKFVGFGDRPGALSPRGWLEKVIEHGATPESARTARVTPCVRRSPILVLAHGSGAHVANETRARNGPIRLPNGRS